MVNTEGYRRCNMGIWDTSVPGIEFDNYGVSNYSKIIQKLMEMYPRGEKGREDWGNLIEVVQRKGKSNKYDCIVGVSGGVDSSYLLYIIKQYGLRPLAVTVDNGWNSDIAVKNIKKMTNALCVDLETYVINYEEIIDLLRAYMQSGLPWIDVPSDTAIKAVMYKIALKERVKFIFRGNDFRSEGKQPREWTYSDSRQLNYIHKIFGQLKKLKSFPKLSFTKIIYAGFIRGIKDIKPYYYLDYQKKIARKFLEENFGWEYYGGHHHENLFTKFVITYWLPGKFGIDKRLINLSAQVMSGEISREHALNQIKMPFDKEENIEEVRNLTIKKLGITEDEFSKIWMSENKYFMDYPSYYKMINSVKKYLAPILSLVYPQKPMTFVEMEVRNDFGKKSV